MVTAVSSKGRSFLIDGRKLKAINQWFHKENARLQGIKDKQGDQRRTTNYQKNLADKRNRQVNDYMSKTAKKIINYCIANDIGTLVVGYHETFQQNSHMGRQKNQNFVSIPYGKLRNIQCSVDICIQQSSMSSSVQSSLYAFSAETVRLRILCMIDRNYIVIPERSLGSITFFLFHKKNPIQLT